VREQVGEVAPRELGTDVRTMPGLLGHKLGSSATVSEAAQNQICAYLSIALLAGLLANALAGWWWADPAAALAIPALLAAKEGVDSWRGKSCDCC
jgi:divalent metal cation (Fe/Co/Zn/Cd) transporter